MPFCKITFTPPGVLRSALLGCAIGRQRPCSAILPISRRCSPALTSWRIEAGGSGRRMMSSDAEYLAFLKKSQTDYSGPPSEPAAPASAASAPATTSATSATIGAHPAVKALAERFYVSDADEPFEGVLFPWEKEMFPDEDEFRELIVAPSGQEVRQLTPAQWDPRGEYTDVVAAVAAASGGGGEEEIRVYRVEREGSRVEYFVVGVDRSEKTVVGVRVLAVES